MKTNKETKLFSMMLTNADRKNLEDLSKLTNQMYSNVIRIALVNYLNDQLT